MEIDDKVFSSALRIMGVIRPPAMDTATPISAFLCPHHCVLGPRNVGFWHFVMNRPMAFSQSGDELKGADQERNWRNQHVSEHADRVPSNDFADSGVYTDPNAIEHTEEAK